MNSKKKTLIISTIIVLLLLLAVGGAYAFFTYESGTRSDIVAGQIYMNYEETSTISLTGVFPETKAQALARQDENGVFEFTITGRNTSKYPIYYEIDLLDGGVIAGKTEQSTKILPEHIMIYLERDGEVLVDGLTYLEFDNRRIYAETIPANQATNIEHKYTLRMWVNENVTISDTDPDADYTTSEWNSAYASLKVRVVGDFEEKEVSVPINELVKSRLGSDGVVAISTTGDLYEGTGEIREYRYSGSARYCTYTSGENTYQLNVESETCPKACVLNDGGEFILNSNSDLFSLFGGSCTDIGGTELTSNETEPLDGEVKNYVWFNDEMWRIIGVFKEETADGNTEELVKIIKEEPISNDAYSGINYTYNGKTYVLKPEMPVALGYGYYHWNDALNFGQTNMNDWTQAGSQYYLNDETIDANSYYNSLSTESQKMIEEVTYYLGNVDEESVVKNVYNQERLKDCPDNMCIFEGNQEKWTGKVSLMYPSDYGYAADSSNWETTLLYYGFLPNKGGQNNWMNDSVRVAEWMISPSADYSYYAVNVYYGGRVHYSNVVHNNALSPVLYLKSSVMVSSGDGSYSTPYVLE